MIRAADMLIGSYYNTLNKRDQHALRSTLLSVARDGASVEERWRADADLGDLTPLHWPLEFPEVFTPNGIADEQNERYGFDAFVVNPPFVGGRRIRDTLGVCYRHLIDHAYIGARGNADLSAFFFLRGFRLAQQHGTMGLIATNTIAQGDTRQTGLAAIEADGGSIFRAINNTVTAKVGYKFIMLS
ncbi:hypothetical protein KFU94_12445 [Chloroflexi bacterium TSY]|nr:hypothetical protein [Chloroflexi bacterium TSY]